MSKSALIRIALPAVFFVSGAAALIYEILWSRQFVTVFGNSTYAISIVLAAFMGGLGMGGIYFGRRADRTSDPLRMYALLELGIGASALAIPYLLDLSRAITPSLFASLPPGLSVGAVRLVFSFVILFIPCSLMGGTLPVLARFCVDARNMVGQRIGILYGFNTLGGAFGCSLAGYYLVETLGIAAAGYAAVASNAAIAAAAMVIRRLTRAPAAERAPARPAAAAPSGDPDVRPAPGPNRPRASEADPAAGGAARAVSGARLLLFVAFLSGFTTLACEVLWVRFLAFLCTNTPYTFTAILTIFLVGLALGSFIFRAFLARIENRVRLLGFVQIAVAAAVVGALLAGSSFIIGNGPWAQKRLLGGSFAEQLIGWPILNTLIFALVPTVLMGIVFPLVCAAFTRSLGAVGRSVGLVYGLNTAGCIAGSLAPAFVLIEWIGIQSSLTAIALLNAAVGLALVGVSIQRGEGRRRGPALAGAAAAVAVAAGLLAPGDLTQRVFLNGLVTVGPHAQIVHYDEGRTGTSTIVQDRIDGLKGLFINSVYEVPTTYTAVAIFKLMGHLGPLLHPDPGHVLAICFGGGIAGGALNLHPAVRRLDIVDIEGSVIEAARELRDYNNDLHSSPKLRTFIEDGRNYLLTCGEQYPLIICDSTHPKSADSWVLYTVEFYQTVAARLARHGLFIQWVPYHAISENEFRIIVRTFLEVFPQGSLWMVFGYDERAALWGYTLLVGGEDEFSIDLDLMRRRLSASEVAADLERYQMQTPEWILRHFVCGPKTLREWTAGYPVNTDDLPLTQYRTRWSDGPAASYSMFQPIQENPWPYLRGLDEVPNQAMLRQRLDIHLEAQRLAMEGEWTTAARLMRGDPKFDMNRVNAVKAKAWHQSFAERFGRLLGEPAEPPAGLPLEPPAGDAASPPGLRP